MEKKFTDDTFLARWLNGQLTEEELAEFESQDDFVLYQKIATSSEELQVPKRDKKQGWEKLSELTNAATKEKEPARIRRLGNLWKYAVAASVLLVIGYFALWQGSGMTNITSPVALQKTYELPDGSEVQLNASSTLSFNEASFLSDRKLRLDGEAFFSVKKGSQFTVQTDEGDVRVLGTSFNVKARKDKLNVVCYTGKVGVSFDAFKSTKILNPGDQISAKNKRILMQNNTEVKQSQPAWMNGESRFQNVDMIEVIEELERQYAIDIKYPDDLLAIKDYTGGFPNNDLQTALQVVFSSIKYQYRITGKDEVVVFK